MKKLRSDAGVIYFLRFNSGLKKNDVIMSIINIKRLTITHGFMMPNRTYSHTM